MKSPQENPISTDSVQPPDPPDWFTPEEKNRFVKILKRLKAAIDEWTDASNELETFWEALEKDRLPSQQDESLQVQKVEAKMWREIFKQMAKRPLSRMKSISTKVIRAAARQIPAVPRETAEEDAMIAGLAVYKVPYLPKEHPCWKELRRHVTAVLMEEYPSEKPSHS